jgi:protein NrfC
MSVTRRDFIIATSATFAVSSVPVVYSMDVDGKRLAMIHDESKCIGCNACTDACRTTNNVPEGYSRLEIIRTDVGGKYPDKEFKFFRHSCQHCSDAPCVEVCPSGASFIDKETGIVDVNPDKCVGCQYCVAACPYQVRFIHPETKTPDKCDFCRKTNLAQGKLPACVESCPSNALVFGDLNDPESEVSKIIAANPTYRMKVELGTQPNLFHIPDSNGGKA